MRGRQRLTRLARALGSDRCPVCDRARFGLVQFVAADRTVPAQPPCPACGQLRSFTPNMNSAVGDLAPDH